jgi:hypothetical protein
MSDQDWRDLEKLWQALPAKAAPAADELRRLQKWRWASIALIAGEATLSLVGLAGSIWLLTRGDAFALVLGVATIGLLFVAAGLSIWARSIAPARLDDPVAQALALAVRRARVGVRLALATQWAVCGGMVFTAIATLTPGFIGTLGHEDAYVGSLAIGITQLWLALSLAGALIYHRKRAADLARLEALAASLSDPV